MKRIEINKIRNNLITYNLIFSNKNYKLYRSLILTIHENR